MHPEVIFDSDHNHVPSEDLTEASCTPPGPDNPPPDVPDRTPVWALDQP